MFGWFAPKSPLGTWEKTWTEIHFDWLVQVLGFSRLESAEVLLPTDEFFPESYGPDEDVAAGLLDRLSGYLQIDTAGIDLQFVTELQQQQSDPNHTWLDVEVIQIGAAQLEDHELLIATLSRELSRIYLLREKLISGDDPTGPWLTDLMPAVLGAGIFVANCVIREHAEWMGDHQWKSLRRHGHLPARALGYALALFAWARGERPRWSEYLRPDAAEVLIDGLRYLDRSGDSLFRPDRDALPLGRPPLADLVVQLETGTPSFRMAALWWLGDLGTDAAEAAGPAVLAAMQDDDWELRREAVHTMAAFRLCDEQAAETLLRLLRDHRPEVRAAAAACTGELQFDSQEFLSDLAFLLEDSDRQVAQAAAEALAKFGRQAEPMLPYLLAALQRGLIECDEPLAAAVVDALLSVSPKNLEERLDEYFSGDDDLHGLALRALRHCRDDREVQ